MHQHWHFTPVLSDVWAFWVVSLSHRYCPRPTTRRRSWKLLTPRFQWLAWTFPTWRKSCSLVFSAPSATLPNARPCTKLLVFWSLCCLLLLQPSCCCLLFQWKTLNTLGFWSITRWHSSSNRWLWNITVRWIMIKTIRRPMMFNGFWNLERLSPRTLSHDDDDDLSLGGSWRYDSFGSSLWLDRDYETFKNNFVQIVGLDYS